MIPDCTLLGVFAKYWEPGAVKTRLAESVGAPKAAEIHRIFLDSLLTRTAPCAGARVLAFAPPDRQTAFRELAGDNWELQTQVAGDLGQRMAEFIRQALSRAERVVLIGSDSPDLPLEFIARAFGVLENCDLVLGPAADGGYYLVGAAREVPPIFAGIDWSTPHVWEQTVRRLNATNIAWHTLPQWYDVDDKATLTQLLLNLSREAVEDPDLGTLHQRLLKALA